MNNQGDIQSHKINDQVVTAAGFDPALPALPDCFQVQMKLAVLQNSLCAKLYIKLCEVSSYIKSEYLNSNLTVAWMQIGSFGPCVLFLVCLKRYLVFLPKNRAKKGKVGEFSLFCSFSFLFTMAKVCNITPKSE